MMDNLNPTPEEARALAIRDAVEAMRGCQTDYHSVVIEGREIPKLAMKIRKDTPPDTVSLQLDGRWEIDVPFDIAPTVAWMIANALAVGSGYAHLGSMNKERPFAPEVRGLPSGLLGASHD